MKNKFNAKVDYSDIDEQKGLTSPKFLFRKRKMDYSYEKSDKNANGSSNTSTSNNPDSKEVVMSNINLSNKEISNNSLGDEKEINQSKKFLNCK